MSDGPFPQALSDNGVMQKIKTPYGLVVTWVFRSPLRLFLSLFLLLATAEGGVYLALDANVRSASRRQAISHNSNDGKLIAKVLREHFKGVVAYTESYSTRFFLRKYTEDIDRPLLESTLQQMEEGNEHIDRVIVTDPAGTLLASYPKDDTVIGKNFAYRQWYKDVTAANKSTVSEIYRSAAETKAIVVAITTPLKREDGVIVGYLSSQMRIETLTNWLREHRPSEMSTVHVIDRNGNVVRNPDPPSGNLINIKNYPAFEPVSKGGNTWVIAVDPFTSVPSLITSYKVDEFDWNVLISQPTVEVFAAVEDLTRLMKIGALASFLALLAWLYQWLNSVRRYTAEHEFAVQKIDALNHDLSQQIGKLNASEVRFRMLADTIPQLAWISDTSGKIEFFNQRWIDYTGLDLAQSTGPLAGGLIHEEDQADLRTKWSHSLASGELFETRYRLRKATGIYRWQLARALPLFDQKGRISNWFGTCTDIDEQMREQQEVTVVKRRFETIINSLDVIIWSVDKAGVVQFYEGRGMRVAGVAHEERVGRSFLEIYPVNHPVHSGIEGALRGISSTFETYINGVIFEVSGSPVYDSAGEIIGAAGVCSNISERKSMQLSLVESNLRLESVISSSPVIMWAMDARGTLTLNDGKALTSLGMSPGSGVGESIFDLIGGEPELVALVNGALAGQQTFGETEFRQRYFESTFTPVKDLNGTVQGVNGISLDITVRRLAELAQRDMEVRERSALQSAKTKSEFLANMSHEIRTPINGVIGMTDLLLDTPLSPQQREYADSVRLSADALLTVINDILDFSKIEAGKLDFEDIRFSMRHLLFDIEKSFTHIVNKRSLALLVTESLGDRSNYRGDPGRIRQVINNLMSNAIKFTRTGSIWVSLSHDTNSLEPEGFDQLRVVVRDSGVGIPAEALSRLFQAFTQADASTARRFGGTGLGLSISKHLVEMMHGTIGVESVEGEGSTFSFTIKLRPISAAQMQPKVANIVKVSEQHLGKRILLAEDNAINQKVALGMLEKMGYRANAVANGKEALAALNMIRYDLVLMDCQMPEMDGYEAASRIRRLPEPWAAELPIVAMTANAFKEDRDKCLAAGMNDYVSKPVRAADLSQVIEQWLSVIRKKSA